MTCCHCPDCAARLARIEALLERMAPPPEPEPEPAPVPPVILALAGAFGRSVFNSREAWQKAWDQPALMDSLHAAGINGPHGLGRWLARHETAGVQRSGVERAGTVWHVCDFVLRGETA